MTMTRQMLSAFLILALLAAVAVGATTLARMSLDELATAADVVARVRCLGNESKWERGEIWTLTGFEVMETLKGTVPRLITVRLLGGRVDHLISTVDGAPRFGPGEEVFLFLERTRDGEFSVTGWVQGTFRIHRDAGTGQESVTQDSGAASVFDPSTRRFRATAIRKLPVEAFKHRLAEALERQQSRRRP